MYTVLAIVNVCINEISFEDRQVNQTGNQIDRNVLKWYKSELRVFHRVEITFVDRDGDRLKVQAQVGQNLLEVAQENGIDLEGRCQLQ
jgi:hypothetical protein